MNSDLIISKLKDILSKKDEIMFAYLFGSLSKGKETELSDVDVAIYINQNKLPPSSIFGYKADMISELEKNLDYDIDLVILNDASLLLSFNIIKNGELIFCNSEKEKVNFHFETQRDYLDFKPVLEEQNNSLNNWVNSENSEEENKW